MGWQTGITSIAFLTALQIQSLLVINDANYVFENWQTTLFIIAISFFAIIFNTYLANRLPLVEGIVLILHICGFFAILIPLWVLAPRNTAEEVFTQFSDGGNWGNIGLSCLVGMLSPIFSFIGPDSAVHMSEEIRDSSWVLPRAMIWTCLLNGTLGFVMLVTFCFCLGNVGQILSNPDVMPFVQTFYIATNSNAGTSVMTAILIILTICGCISNVATASRQMFAFARDEGLPFSKFLAHVSEPNMTPNPTFCLYDTNCNDLTGTTGLGHPSELGPCFFLYHYPSILNQHWLQHCLQRHRLPWNCSSHLFLHHLYYLCPHQALEKGASPSCSLESRQMGWSNQRLLDPLPRHCLHLHLLP